MKNLAKILDQPERLVTKAVNKLEDLNGYPSHDARLLAENTQAVRQKLNDLGLDPDDTTGEELYQALIARFQRDSALIDKALGVSGQGSAGKRMMQALKLVESTVRTAEVWALRQNAAKNLLRDRPPKKLMKHLNYRSVESLLKRQTVAEIYLALPFVESSSWQRSFNKAAAQLSSASYELRSPAIAAMSARQWSGIDPGENLLSISNLAGVAGLWTPKTRKKTPVLTLSLMLMDGLERLTHSSSQGSLADVNPALVWWEQSKNLVANCKGQPVSLNYIDVARDHLEGSAYKKRQKLNGQTSLWNELIGRYQNQVERIEESAADLEAAGESLVPKTSKNLAVEYAEAIANEF